MSEILAIEGGVRSNTKPFPEDLTKINKKGLSRVVSSLETGRLSIFNNENITAFENKFSKFIGSKSSIFVTNCTAAITSTLMSLDLPKGSKIILPAYTYAATAMPVISLGLKPCFVDISPDNFNISPDLLSSNLNKSVSAVIIVHMFGAPCDIKAITSIISDYPKIKLIEDCAQATGASVYNKRVGSFGIGCHSFGDSKLLRIGEGGAVTANDTDLVDRIKLVRHEGECWIKTKRSTTEKFSPKFDDILYNFDYVSKGFNFRPLPIQASLAENKLTTLIQEIAERNKLAKILTSKLKHFNNITLPTTPKGSKSAQYAFPFVINSEEFDRDTFLFSLLMEGIPAGVHFPKTLPSFKIFSAGQANHYKNAERACNSQIVLPLYPALKKEHILATVDGITKVINRLNEEPVKIKSLTKKLKGKIGIKNLYSGMFMTI